MSNRDPLKQEAYSINPFSYDSKLLVSQSCDTKNFGGFLVQSHNSFINGYYQSSGKKPGLHVDVIPGLSGKKHSATPQAIGAPILKGQESLPGVSSAQREYPMALVKKQVK
jgi:hypothetical protein